MRITISRTLECTIISPTTTTNLQIWANLIGQIVIFQEMFFGASIREPNFVSFSGSLQSPPPPVQQIEQPPYDIENAISDEVGINTQENAIIRGK